MNPLTIENLNIARLELQCKNSCKLCKLSSFITNRNDKVLKLDTLLDLLQKRQLYETLNSFYTSELKECIFFTEPEDNSVILSSWDGLFSELIKEADIKSMIALYNECSSDTIRNGKNFVTVIKNIQKLNTDDLYKELCKKLDLY